MANLPGIVGAVALGVSMSQFPEFTQQYQQRLGGAVDELRIITQDFDRAAADQNMTREQALSTYKGSTFLENRVVDMAATFERYENLSEDLRILEDADSVGRFTSFLHMTDNQLVQNTWNAYEPAVPVTSDGFVFAIIGAMGGFYGLTQITGIITRRRKKTT